MAAIHRIVELNRRRRHPHSRLLRSNANIRTNLNQLDILSDREIIRRYRLPRNEILTLLELLTPDLRRSTERNYALTPAVQLLCSLLYYTTGSFLQTIGDGLGLSKASVSRCVQAVTTVLVRHAPEYIRFPRTQADVHDTHRGFHSIANIPQVIGAIDGTLIPIITQRIDEPMYISRKGYSAINVQVICNHEGVITDIVAKWPGDTHDAFIWSNSAISQAAKNGQFGDSWLLGDSGYPLRLYLLTPILHPRNAAEERFSNTHRLTRCIIERTFGVWKMRFRCFDKSSGGLHFTPAKCCAVIVITAMLHNIAVRA
ncbi:putative nuclease HARBI1 [Huso huso]|uniref:Putative nuclease HARBI1 n=1 Tax=Huso huso TaxID=61971 RepID=A0ABR0ZGW8_HUSHU